MRITKSRSILQATCSPKPTSMGDPNSAVITLTLRCNALRLVAAADSPADLTLLWHSNSSYEADAAPRVFSTKTAGFELPAQEGHPLLAAEALHGWRVLLAEDNK